MEEVRPTDRKERMKHHEQKNPKGSVYAYGTECLCPVRRKGKHQKEPDAESANDTLDFDRDKQERLCTEMNHRAEVYTVEMSAYGQPKAREKLRERTAPMLDKPFVLPAGQYPRKQREKDALAERRAAGDLVIRFFIEALDSMGYDRAQINSTVEEARKNYEQFLEWAKDGEYVAYTKLGRCVAQMTGGSTEVARVPGAGPIFSTEF